MTTGNLLLTLIIGLSATLIYPLAFWHPLFPAVGTRIEPHGQYTVDHPSATYPPTGEISDMSAPPAVLTLAACLMLPLCTGAAETDLTITDPYVRLVPPGSTNTVAFMTITNHSNSDRKLVSAESPVAGTVELHTHLHDQGVMRMRQVADIELKAGGRAELKPGGYHVMLIGLKQPLQESERVALTLRFDDGSTKKLEAPVRKPQAMRQPEPAAAADRH